MKNEIKTSPLLCDPETGVCEISGTSGTEENIKISSREKPIRIIYFTDPICSSCWGIEPQLRKLKLEYEHDIEIDYHMGGLLPSWQSYGGSDVSKPADVAHHWEEVSPYYDMPIDGSVWLEDPLHSSFPPSIAFKAAQIQDKEKAIAFLRRIREMVFLEKKNITKWEHLEKAAVEVGIDSERMKTDFEGKANQLFQNDLELAVKLGVRGFPTLFFTDANDNRWTVYGFRPYEQFEQAVLKLHPEARKQPVKSSPESLFTLFNTLTTKEFATLTSTNMDETTIILNDLKDSGHVTKQTYKNGEIWAGKHAN